MMIFMDKINYITNPDELTEAEIEFLIQKNSIQTDIIEHTHSTSKTRGIIGINTPYNTTSQNINTNLCPNCNTCMYLINDQFGGSIICSNCGEVINDCVIDHAPEWKNYEDNASTLNRCGMPTNELLPQSSLGSTLGGSCSCRLKTLHNWGMMPHKERSLNTVLSTIKEKCNAAGLLGCIADDAKILYKIASECKGENRDSIIIRGKNRIGLMSACVFYACKRRGQTKSPKEIAVMFDIKPSRVTRGCKNFIRYAQYKNIDYNTNLSHPSQYMRQFCEKYDIDKKTENIITEISLNIQKLNIIHSHTPISIAAACVLLYATEFTVEKLTKIVIASGFNISVATLMKAYNKIYEHRSVLMNGDAVLELIKKYEGLHNNMVVSDNLKARLEIIQKINLETYNDAFNIPLDNYLSYNITQHNITTASDCIKYFNEIKCQSIIGIDKLY